MSHSSGEVFADGRRVGWFEYNGTVGVAWPRIFATHDDLTDNWRNDACQPWLETCDHAKSPAILFAHEGDGYGWESGCCLACMRITGPLDPDGDDPDVFVEFILRGDPRLPVPPSFEP